MSDAKYNGHTAEEVIELMGMLAAQHDVHSADETLAIVRRGYALIKDQQSRLEAYENLCERLFRCVNILPPDLADELRLTQMKTFVVEKQESNS